ncbi:MAG: gamma-glutamyltransferase [Actinomycetota bacterium]|nr:gamma-glutamyltransferase [Actinomycetota bacterium]
MSDRGVVAGGHPATAEAGAWALRQGGNAVDAAVAAVLTSFAAESALTGLGAGGYMLVHDSQGSEVIDFFVEAPGRVGTTRRSELIPAPVQFTDAVTQVFNVGAASCGVPGTAAGLEVALKRSGSMQIADLVTPAISAARDGVALNATQAYLFQILAPILTHEPEAAEIYAPGGTLLREGELFRFPDLAGALELLAAEGSAPFYTGDVARKVSDWVLERGGTLASDDLAAYAPIVREPVVARFRDREIVTNPPPSSGGILIAFALELMERLGSAGLDETVAVMAAAQEARAEGFATDLSRESFAAEFLDAGRLDRAAQVASSRLGSTTHITAVDSEGRCASVTCSNGTGSGLIVPGTGVHVNNMLGEEDLNPRGFHLWDPGSRLPSMMAPTVILRDGELEAGLGSAGSNRIRSAIVQTILRLLVDGLDATAAVTAPRVHFEGGALQAEPGADSEALARLEARGVPVERWADINPFFGGVQAVARDPATGVLNAAGDPRRSGSVAFA